MANHKQALKRHRQSLKARDRNIHNKSRVRTVVKRALANEGKAPDAAAASFREAESLIQHVASLGVIPKKRASRKVSRLAKRLIAPGT